MGSDPGRPPSHDVPGTLNRMEALVAIYTTTEPIVKQPQPQPWDPTCPACLSGFGPTDPNDPITKISVEPAQAG